MGGAFCLHILYSHPGGESLQEIKQDTKPLGDQAKKTKQPL